MLSVPHLIVIFVVALIIFGPEKLPELARNLGKVMSEFRKVTGDLRSSFEGHMRDLEREAQERRITAVPAPANALPPRATVADASASPNLLAPQPGEPAILPAAGAVPTEAPTARPEAERLDATAYPSDAAPDLSLVGLPAPEDTPGSNQNPEQVSSDGHTRPA